jgi:putative transposase
VKKTESNNMEGGEISERRADGCDALLLTHLQDKKSPESKHRKYKRRLASSKPIQELSDGTVPRIKLSGKLFEIGAGDIGRLSRLCRNLDKLQAKCDTAKHAKQRLRFRKAAMRARERIRNLVSDSYKKSAYFLACQYDMILLPKFETSKMVMRAHRRIRSKTVRMMLTWAHYRFQTTLMNTAKRTGATVKIVDEAYTSKTCGKCGAIHNALGGSKMFKCPVPNCGHVVDRDANGSRNILLRNAFEINFTIAPSPDGIAVQGLTG